MSRWRPRPGVLAAAAALVAPYSWWATARPPFSVSGLVAVVGAGLVAIVVGTRRRRAPWVPSGRQATAGLLVWTGLAAALAGWQLAAYLQHPRREHPTLSSLTNAVLDTHASRASGFVVWLALAAVLARR